MTETKLTDEQLRELAKTPEMCAELAIAQAKTPVHLTALIAEAIRDAVRRDRVEFDKVLADRTAECFCVEQDSPCAECTEVSRVRGWLKARPVR